MHPTIPGRVSAIIPSYNHERFVAQAIQSVIDQTYQDIELIVIDDGSKDGSVAIIESMVDACNKRFSRFEFRSRANVGLAKTLDEALGWAQGEYVAFLASDDMWLPGKSALQVCQIEKEPRVGAVYGGVRNIDVSGRQLDLVASRRIEVYDFEHIFLHKPSTLRPVTGLYRRSALEAIDGFRRSSPIEDLYLYLYITNAGFLLKTFPDVQAFYRQHFSNTSGPKNIERMQQLAFELFARFDSHPKYQVALNNLSLACFLTAAPYEKALALRYFPRAVRSIGDRRFFEGLFKLLIPSCFVPFLKKLRA